MLIVLMTDSTKNKRQPIGASHKNRDMETNNNQLKVGDKITSFYAVATTRKIGFPSDFKGQWMAIVTNPVELFSTESQKDCFLQLAESLEKKNCQVIGLSSSGMTNDLEWQRSLKELADDDTRRALVENLPIINDSGLAVARQCGIVGETDEKLPSASIYFIDPDSVLRFESNFLQADNSLLAESMERLQQIQAERLNVRLSQHKHVAVEQPTDEMSCWYF